MPKDVVEVELKIKTKWGKFTLHTYHHTRTEKYSPWKKVSHCRIHLRRIQSCHERTKEPHVRDCSTDSGTFITSGQGMGYPPKIFYADSDLDVEIHPHIPNLQEYCMTCVSKKTRCTCKPMSDWSADLIDSTQPDCPNNNSNNNKNDREDRQDHPLSSDWSDQENIWSGKTYDKVRPTSLTPVQMPPPLRDGEESDWGDNLYPHQYRAKAQSQVLIRQPPPVGLTGARN